MVNYKKHITIDSNKRFGKPVIIGTRISVFDVLNWLANGMSHQDILNDFPELTEEAINACLAFVAARESRLRVQSNEAVI